MPTVKRVTSPREPVLETIKFTSKEARDKYFEVMVKPTKYLIEKFENAGKYMICIYPREMCTRRKP